jgi:hypothetical protein
MIYPVFVVGRKRSDYETTTGSDHMQPIALLSTFQVYFKLAEGSANTIK